MEVPVAVKAVQKVILDFARKLVGEIVRLGRLHEQPDEARIAATNSYACALRVGADCVRVVL